MARESIDKMVDLTVGEFNGDSASNCRQEGTWVVTVPRLLETRAFSLMQRHRSTNGNKNSSPGPSHARVERTQAHRTPAITNKESWRSGGTEDIRAWSGA